MPPLLLLVPHLILLGIFASCCKSRYKTSTANRTNSYVGPTTPVDEKQTTPPHAGGARTTPLPPPTTTAAPTTTTTTGNATSSTNQSSLQPVSSSPAANSEKRRQRAAAAATGVKTPMSSGAEDDMVSQTGRKQGKDSPKQKQTNEDKGRPAPQKKTPELKKATEKTGEDARKLEQKTQEGGVDVEPAEAKVTPTTNKDPDAKKRGAWFSRERIRKKLGMKSAPSSPQGATAPKSPLTPAKPDAPRRKPQNWHDVVPESNITDDLTDFDVTKHTQDDTKDGAAETQSGYDELKK